MRLIGWQCYFKARANYCILMKDYKDNLYSFEKHTLVNQSQ